MSKTRGITQNAYTSSNKIHHIITLAVIHLNDNEL